MERLYNGITLPDEWPPRRSYEEYFEGVTPPYLQNPPEVIPVDVGRQLFVDDFLIEETNLKPVYYKAKKYEGNPVLFPETPWEKDEALPCACPKSGGVWYDEAAKKYKMWYEAGWLHQMAYAESDDGIRWMRPDLDIEPGTNKILTYGSNLPENKTVMGKDETYFRPDSTTVWMDQYTDDESQRYKLFLRNPDGYVGGIIAASPDGIHWNNPHITSNLNDRSTFFYNPFRKKWVYSIRLGELAATNPDGSPYYVRCRYYYEHDDFYAGANWGEEERVKWLYCDKFDQPNPYIGFKPQLYNIDAVAYESIMLGMFQIMYGPENDRCERGGMPKITELTPIYSRDGFHFTRPSRESFIEASLTKGSWDRGYIQSVGGVCIVKEDELWFYYIGFSGDEDNKNPIWYENGMYSGGATGLAKLRRDGFVSRSTEEASEGYLTTRKLTFTDKKHLFVNFKGTISAELLSETGEVLACSQEITGDYTKKQLPFADFNLASVSSKPIRLRFRLKQGEIFAFWFSADETGDSGGYSAAGDAGK